MKHRESDRPVVSSVYLAEDLSRRRNEYTFSFSFPSVPGWVRARACLRHLPPPVEPAARRPIGLSRPRCTDVSKVEIIPGAVADALHGICFDVAASNERFGSSLGFSEGTVNSSARRTFGGS